MTKFFINLARKLSAACPYTIIPGRTGDQLADLGKTVNGTPISVCRMALEADFIIGVGSIVPHHIPGFSGGAKIVQPGITGPETTGATHLLSVRGEDSWLGVLENPVRAEMEEVADRVGLSAVFNCVLDSKGNLIKGLLRRSPGRFQGGCYSFPARSTGCEFPDPVILLSPVLILVTSSSGRLTKLSTRREKL